ncbi:effector-associated constant component EACC1 [Rugosimonospora acidiphila]
MADVALIVSGYPGIQPAQLDLMTRELATDIQRYARLAARPVQSTPAPGSKSGSAVDIGSLLLTGVFSASTVKALSSVLKTWIAHRRAGTITIRDGDRKIEIAGGTPKELGEALSQLTGFWEQRD